MKLKNFNKYFFVYLSLILFSSVFFITKTYNLHVNNSMAEWIINYQGGFGRRGFLGEIFSQISLVFNFPIRKLVLLFLYILFICFYLMTFFYLKNLKKNYLFIFSLFSPLVFVFPISELEALGRKDLLIPLLFLSFCFLFNKLNFYSLSIFLLIFYSILLLTHEVSIFYLPFFYFLLFCKMSNFSMLKCFIILFITSIFLLIIFLLSISIHSPENIKEMCDWIEINLNDKCGLGAYVLDRRLIDNINELGGVKFIDIIRGFLILFIGNLAVFLSIYNSSKEKLFFNLQIKYILLFLFLLSLIPFGIAVDWGRWYHLSSIMLVLAYFFCIKNNLIIFNHNSALIKMINEIFSKKKFFFLVLFIFCFSWNPKAVYHEDIGSIPIYRVLGKIIKYY